MVQTAEDRSEILKPYVPRLLIDWLRETPDARSRTIDGSLVFVDLSGFTRMSERLARIGKAGAEEVTDIIGSSFATLLEVAYQNGGSLIKFGGDALLLFFTGPDHPVSACGAAAGMRRRLREMGPIRTSAGMVTLRMSVGIHSGTFHFFLLGTLHRELIITGPSATQSVDMESTAGAGEVVISPDTARSIDPSMVGARKGPGFLLRGSPSGAAHAELTPVVAGVDPSVGIPAAIRTHLLQGEFEPEHRLATVAFLHFEGVDARCTDSRCLALVPDLDSLVDRVQVAAADGEVTFLGSDIDRDGGKIILVAGVPQSPGRDEERMVRVLRSIMDADGPIAIRAGLNRGSVFAGAIGPPYRRTYTVMGDTVNLAARLMQSASPGSILATQPVIERTRSRFDVTALEPLTVKGKARPVDAYSVGAVAEQVIMQPAVLGPLVGREEEVKTLLSVLDSARAGQGRIVELTGEPGIGKSRLVDEMRARAGDMTIFSAACEPYEASTPYSSFRAILLSLLGISGLDGELAAHLHDLVETVAPELLQWLPLIAIPLGVDVPATAETDRLEHRFRKPVLEQATDTLVARILPSPALLIFDDVHWMDEGSRDLLRYLAREVTGRAWVICVTRRDVGTGFVAPPGPGTVSIVLRPLQAEDAAVLAWGGTEGIQLAPHEIEELAARSGGNPLFLKELLAATQAAGGVDALPDSVEAVIMARIDALPSHDRTLLRRASVLGRTFSAGLLEAVLPDDGPSRDGHAWEGLGDFITRDEGGTFRFAHALLRDAAYEGLSFRLRRLLHARVGELIEKSAAGNPEEQAELLSLHFFHARRFEEASRYSTVAGDRAKAIYANAEAADFYQRALDAARHAFGAIPSDLGRVSEALGDVRKLTGQYREADRAYRAALRLQHDGRVGEGRLLLKRARAHQESGRYIHALRSISRGLRALELTDGEEAARQRTQLAVGYASVRQEQGRYRDAIRWCRRAIGEATVAGDREALAQAYYLLDAAYVGIGKPDEARYSERALAIYSDLGDLWRQAVVLNNMGAFAYLEGRWEEALTLYERARDAWKKTGDEVNAAYGTGNIAEILSDRGSLEEAEALFRQALRVWKTADHRSTVASAISQLGRVASRAGRFEQAMQLFEEARSLARDVRAEGEVLETNARIAECLLLQGHAEEALALSLDALGRAKALGGVAAQSPMAHRVRAYALMQMGSLDEAAVALDQSLELARSRKATFEVALTLRALMDLASLRGEPAPSEAQESRPILDQLGVVSVPEIPLPVLAR
jgi:predicted ATPase/class 3 adenylate cyclase